jgi:hypothetical protein
MPLKEPATWRLVLLEGDIDLRLQGLWYELWHAEFSRINDDGEFTELVSQFMRAAYSKGYIDALEEDVRGERGKLCRDNGYRYPKM